jgi:hypothetical protein
MSIFHRISDILKADKFEETGRDPICQNMKN